MSLPDSSDDVNHENHNQDPKHTEDNCESDQTFGGAITWFHVNLFVFSKEIANKQSIQMISSTIGHTSQQKTISHFNRSPSLI